MLSLESRSVRSSSQGYRRNDFDRANLVVLQHLDVVDPFVTLHKETIAKKYHDQGLRRTDAEVTREHNSTFLPWFKEHVLANPREEGSTDAFLINCIGRCSGKKLKRK